MHPVLLFYWQRTPFLRHTLSLAAGITIQVYYPLPPAGIAGIAFAGTLLLLGLFAIPIPWRFRWKRWALPAATLLFFSLGALVCRCRDVRNDPYWLGRYACSDPAPLVLCILDETPIRKERSTSVVVSVRGVSDRGQWTTLRGKAVMYLTNGHTIETWWPGDTLWVRQWPLPITNNRNPGQRNNYQQQLNRGITHRLFVRQQVFFRPAKTRGLAKSLAWMRQGLLGQLNRYIPDPQAAGLAGALLIGYRPALDPELSRSYRDTGVMHVIAISGMHLALIGGALQWLLKPIGQFRRGGQLTQLIVIACLWTFSLLAGGAPSIWRATLLFTSIGIGQLAGQRGNSLNTLFASAFLLLCYEPFWITDLGFQLSFTAVGGILLLGRTLSRLFSHRQFWWHAPGQIIAISLAAQLLTTPITLYHFHQFPLSFLVSNLVAVPLSSLILIGELIVLALGAFPAAAMLAGSVLTLLIGLMNQSIRLVAAIPGSLLDGLHWSATESILLFFLVLSGVHWLVNNGRGGLQASLLLSLLLLGCQGWQLRERARQSLLIVYDIPGTTAIDLIRGTTCLWGHYGPTNKEVPTNQQVVNTARAHFGITKENPFLWRPYQQLAGTTVLIADRNYRPSPDKRGSIDLLLICQQAPYDGADWIKGLTIRQAVIDGSVSRKKRQLWRALLASRNIPVHDTRSEGAFVSSLR